ncbi:hypothetical protein [Methylotenera versatilis]|uniref:Atrophin-1 multi-domain protein n=1 Tax=Methylotenera versatilis (strain 301) TaxID=666681 RepID=D7DLF0_METV0|nr:hypothetical protein [Methylotenera versatilis]ADI30621.1 conserved hypothetical protein [Methylotenera versatilis 301]
MNTKMRVISVGKCLFACLLITYPTVNVYAEVSSAVINKFGRYEQPFSADSLWNSRPVEPSFASDEIPKSLYFPAVQEGEFSTGFFLAKPTDPPMVIKGRTGKAGLWDVDAESFRSDITIPHWPSNVVPAAGGDGHADVVDPVNRVIHSFYQLKSIGGQWTATQYAWTPLNGRGWGNPAHYFQGARATGVPAGAGVIRKHEVNDGDTMYRHALAMSLTNNGLAANPAYIYPATSADGFAAKDNYGKVPEGALLMLPSTFNLDKLKTPELKKIAATLKTYGAYVVDANYGTPFVIYVENGSGFNLHKAVWNNIAKVELDMIRQSLRQVISAKGWVDGNSKAFIPPKNFNLLSMRGQWQLKSEGPMGVFDTLQQAVVFNKTNASVIQVNSSGRGLSHTSWALPQQGKSYSLRAVTSGGGKLRFQIFDKTLKKLTFDSNELSDGQIITFEWPSQDFQPIVTAISGVGKSSSVSATLSEIVK